MKINGIEVEEETNCWCGYKSYYHHTSSANRKDGKITVWYKCSNGHRTPLDINYKTTNKPKEKKVKKNEKPKKEVST